MTKSEILELIDDLRTRGVKHAVVTDDTIVVDFFPPEPAPVAPAPRKPVREDAEDKKPPQKPLPAGLGYREV